MRVTPDYNVKNIAYPFYVLDPTTVNNTLRELKKQGDEYKNVSGTNLLFKCVHSVEGDIIYKSSSRAKSFFQITDKKKNQLPFGIQISKSQVKAHYGIVTRKDSTASSNVNEFLTVYFLVNQEMTPDELEQHVSVSKGSTGVLTGEGTPVTFEQLADLIDRDETADRDIIIGLNNSKAVRKDINGRSIGSLYWVPRGKPAGIDPKTPSDVIIRFSDGFYRGYSNKIATGGRDKTPKFNTNVNTFYKDFSDPTQMRNIQSIIDNSWNQVKETITTKEARDALDEFDIESEPYTETGSSKAFAELTKYFKLDGLDFNHKDFYHKFRNTFIRDFSAYLMVPANMIYFLNTIYYRMYGDPNASYTPCPYKLLVGRPNGASQIKEISDDEETKELLFNKDPNRIKNLTTLYNGTAQSFKLEFTFVNGENKKVSIPMSARSRSGGLQGKSLFINTSGIKMT